MPETSRKSLAKLRYVRNFSDDTSVFHSRTWTLKRTPFGIKMNPPAQWLIKQWSFILAKYTYEIKQFELGEGGFIHKANQLLFNNCYWEKKFLPTLSTKFAFHFFQLTVFLSTWVLRLKQLQWNKGFHHAVRIMLSTSRRDIELRLKKNSVFYLSTCIEIYKVKLTTVTC